MTKATSLSKPRPLFQVSGLRFRRWPILICLILMQLLLEPAREVARVIYLGFPELFSGQVWAYVGMAMFLQMCGALLAIFVVRRVLPKADSHLRWPNAWSSSVAVAVLFGVGMGLVMLIADYWPSLIERQAPPAAYDISSSTSVIGWLGMMLATGLAEETLFRGLLVGILVVLVPGRFRVGPVDLPVAAPIVGLLFAVAHYHSFITDPLHLAISQQIYAFAWALSYVWLMERYDSLLPPIIAHGVGNFVEVAIVMVLMHTWA